MYLSIILIFKSESYYGIFLHALQRRNFNPGEPREHHQDEWSSIKKVLATQNFINERKGRYTLANVCIKFK